MKDITMAPPKTKKTTRKPKTNKPRRKFVKPSRSSPNSCKIVEFYDVGAIEANVAHDFTVAGIVPNIGGVATRAAITAPAFGLYRIAQVEYKITPRFDTYIAGAAPGGDAPVEVPKLYWKMNRYGDAPVGFGQNDMQSLGCKPIRLDDKTVTIKYRPNILLANVGGNAAAQLGGSGQVKMTPWISTDSQADNDNFALSTTEHYGHMMFIECAAAGDGTPIICEVSARVVYEFKTPRIHEAPEAVAKRAATKHVKHSLATSTVKQSQGLLPDGWNTQQTTKY